MEKKNSEQAIGRTKMAFVPKQLANPFAIITQIIAQAVSGDSGNRMDFRGPVKLDKENIRHLETVILPIVDEFSGRLALPRKNYVISIENIGVTATRGDGLDISGFSADLPLFLAILSATLQMDLRQDIIGTGHISSLAGDVAPVLDIPAKLEAAVASANISEFVFPDIDKDQSSIHLTPTIFKKAKDSLFCYKDRIKLTAVEDICDVLKAFITDESIVSCGLNQGFFDVIPNTNDPKRPINRAVSYLLSDSEKRFWAVLQELFFSQGIDEVKNFIRSFMQFYINKGYYPEHFGEQLYRLILSLPISIKRINDLFPVITVDLCIALSQYAQTSDQDDVQILYKVQSGDDLIRQTGVKRIIDEAEPIDTSSEEDILKNIIFEMSEENLSNKVGLELDQARGYYVQKSILVNDGFEFNEAITSFYIHMQRYIQSPEGHMKKSAATAEAVSLISKTFNNTGGYRAALSECKYGINGGLRYVFDMMTNHFKKEKFEKYKDMVLKESIDPLDWDMKVKLAAACKKLYGQYLPIDYRNMEAEQLAHHLERAIRLIVG